MGVRSAAFAAAVFLLAGAGSAVGQTTTRSDSDPTRPIFFSIRPEYYSVAPDMSRLVFIARYDVAVLADRRWLPGRRALVLRFELPFAGAADAPGSSASGSGDAYAQALSVLWRSNRLVLLAGTGLSAPSATDPLLGSGKWIVGPAVAPLVFIPGGGMAFVKLQDFVSIGGDHTRPEAHYLLVTPTLIRPIFRSFWFLVDSETKTDWRSSGRTGVRSGFQLGGIVARGFGVWVKPEVWWGPNRGGQWNVKTGLVWYR